MSRRAEEIKKRIMKRNEQRKNESYEVDFSPYSIESEEYTSVKNKGKNVYGILTKVLFSILLFLGVGIVYQGDKAGQLQPIKNGIEWMFQHEFQFTAVRGWLEDEWNLSLAFWDTGKKSESNTNDYAVPASGKVMQNFERNGQSVTIEMNSQDAVEAMKKGTIIYIGKKEGFGNTIIVQHDDQTESWYGNMKDINVKLYSTVKSRQQIGYVNEDTTGMGELYFAIKQNDEFIDPIQVISFE